MCVRTPSAPWTRCRPTPALWSRSGGREASLSCRCRPWGGFWSEPGSPWVRTEPSRDHRVDCGSECVLCVFKGGGAGPSEHHPCHGDKGQGEDTEAAAAAQHPHVSVFNVHAHRKMSAVKAVFVFQGSTCAFTEQILRNYGFRTGFYR